MLYCFLLDKKIATNTKFNNTLQIIYGLYALVVVKNICLKIYVFVTKATTIAHVNFQARVMEIILVW